MSAFSPLNLLLQAHEQTTGYKAYRSGNNASITCAACGTKSRKVRATEATNGSVLFHAFCGHSTPEVLAALGLQMSDLFVRRDLRTMTPAESRQLRQDALLSRTQAAWAELRKETMVVLIAANQILDGEPLTEDDRTRLKLAALKTFDCYEVLEATNVR